MAFRKRSSNQMSAGTPVAVSAEIAHINNAISLENQRIDDFCLQLGKQYVRTHKAVQGTEYEDFLRAISESEAQIALCRTKLQLLKGVILCPECGNEAPEGSAFCNQCGKKLPPLDSNKFSKCEKCGKTIWKEMDRCVFCGTPVEIPRLSEVTCAKCGQVLVKDTKFCTTCGTPVAAPAVNTPEESQCRCPKCGTYLQKGLAFCTECGQKL